MASRRHHRRWPWIVGAVAVILLAPALVFVLTGDTAHEVSLGQALQRLGGQGGGAAGDRPAPGVYEYRGSGTESLSVPPITQREGPLMPGTVTLQGANCWVLRIDYSTHHWQTYDYCRHVADTWEAGGQTWDLVAIGPINVTNLATLTCVPGTMLLPANAVPGQEWHGRCSGTSTAVSGTVVSAGPYRYLGPATVSVGGRQVQTVKFLRLRTDSGPQVGTERTELWLDPATGLPVRLRQSITVHTKTPFGNSDYTQSGDLALVSMTARS
jgi:hypothetical protein